MEFKMGLKKTESKRLVFHKLTLKEVLEGLLKSKLINEIQAAAIFKKKKLSKVHPIQILSEFDIKDPNNPEKYLAPEELIKWLANFSGNQYFLIDPLKIDIGTMTSLLPNKAFVKRLEILPVDADQEYITIATAEPFMLGWIDDIEQTTRKKVKLVVSNPLTISSCIEDFYTVHKAVSKISRDNKSS